MEHSLKFSFALLLLFTHLTHQGLYGVSLARLHVLNLLLHLFLDLYIRCLLDYFCYLPRSRRLNINRLYIRFLSFCRGLLSLASNALMQKAFALIFVVFHALEVFTNWIFWLINNTFSSFPYGLPLPYLLAWPLSNSLTATVHPRVSIEHLCLALFVLLLVLSFHFMTTVHEDRYFDGQTIGFGNITSIFAFFVT